MNLNVNKGTIIFAPFECVSGVTVHMVETLRSTAVRKEDHHLVNRLWVLAKVILTLKFNLQSQRGLQNLLRLTQNASGSFKLVWGSLFWV